MKRLAALLGVGLLLGASVVTGGAPGRAASLTIVTRAFWSGNAPITTCDKDGVGVDYNMNVLLEISSVTISGIRDGSATTGAGACDGRTVTVVLLRWDRTPISGASGSRVHNGDSNTSTDSITVSIADPPYYSSVDYARVTIT